MVLIRPAPVPGFRGPRSFGLPEFDPFWEKVVEHDVLVAMHSSDSGYERYTNDWMGSDSEMLPFQPQAFRMLSAWRPVEDAVSALVCHGALSRFPALKVAVIENGSSWVEPLLKNLADIYKKMPQDFLENPVEVVKRNIYISPFWEEDLGALAELIGVDHVLFGSDFPHPEGLADPASYVDELRRTARGVGAQDHGRQPGPVDERRRHRPAPMTPAGRPGEHPGDGRRHRRAVRIEAGDRSTAPPPSPTPSSSSRPVGSVPPWSHRGSSRVTGWPSGPPTAPGGWSPCSASSQAGAVLVPVNTRFKGPEAADILRRSRARALVTVTDFLGTDYVAMLERRRARAPRSGHHRGRGTVRPGRAPRLGRLHGPGHGTGARPRSDSAAADLGADDPSDILFTSGTTGVPKGVVQTHGRTLLVATDWVAMTGLTADDRYLMVNPYFHMFGLKAGILAAVCAGATMLPDAGVRRRRRPRPGSHRTGSPSCPGPPPSTRASSTIPTGRPTTCPPSGWR